METRRVGRSGRGQLVASLYFHIPFCSKKCPYCHFYVVPNKLRFHEVLLQGLYLEWQKQRDLLAGQQIASIYFGGGTPTLLGAEAIGQILSWCKTLDLLPDCEITLEANPEEGSFELFSSYKNIGMNRISLGIQSLDDRSLQILERQHDAKRAKQAIFAASAAGFENISIDLMYDLPGQTEASWRYTLDQLSALPISHLSLYNLTIEPHTSFFKRKNTLCLPQPEESLRFLHLALQTMAAIGLERYEISAFAKPGCTSRHNVGYWTFRPFLGFGPSAFSYWEGERFQNMPNLQRYTKALKLGKSSVSYREKLEEKEALKEELAVRLRLKEGAEMHPNHSLETKSVIESLISQELLIQKGSRIQLTERGTLFYDTVASELI